MGRKTTKGGRILNPADAYRKKLRKREIKKNKQQRKKVRELILATKNPDKIKQQIAEIDKLELAGKAEKRHKAKKKQLTETLEKVLARQKLKEEGKDPGKDPFLEDIGSDSDSDNDDDASDDGEENKPTEPNSQSTNKPPAPFVRELYNENGSGTPNSFPAPPVEPPPSNLPNPPPLPEDSGNGELPPPPKPDEPPPLPKEPPPRPNQDGFMPPRPPYPPPNLFPPYPPYAAHPGGPPPHGPTGGGWYPGQFPPPGMVQPPYGGPGAGGPGGPGGPGGHYPPNSANIPYKRAEPPAPTLASRIRTMSQPPQPAPPPPEPLPPQLANLPKKKFVGVPIAVRVKRGVNTKTISSAPTQVSSAKRKSDATGEEQTRADTTEDEDAAYLKYMEEMKSLGAI